MAADGYGISPYACVCMCNTRALSLVVCTVQLATGRTEVTIISGQI